MRLLLIDNYDSFTFNLAHLLGRASGAAPTVVRNDCWSFEQVQAFEPDAVIISPGPGRPDVASDFGICARLIHELACPILGVCLGHQGLAAHLGGRIDYADIVMHGRPSRIRHLGTGLFAGIAQDFQAIRYHSLLVSDPGPAMDATAWTEDGLIMGLQHRHRPLFGVQFHPESISSEHGLALVRNFLRLVRAPGPSPSLSDAAERPRVSRDRFRVFTRTVRRRLDPERCFAALFEDAPNAFWLDSALAGSGAARWSFMGDGSGPWAEHVTYRVGERLVRRAGQEHAGSIFDALAQWLEHRAVDRPQGLDVPMLPGWIGYLGYELKADAGGQPGHPADLPDAQLLFADRIVAFDHLEDRVILLALELTTAEARAEAWFETTVQRMATPALLTEPPPAREQLTFRPELDETAYLERIHAAKAAIRRGETYEVCLTNQFVARGRVDPLVAYRRLRHSNAAPFAAFLRFGELAILSSSPERFLKIGPDRVVEACPIKGTLRRGASRQEDDALAFELRHSVKDRAEHLMIVDLLRNDLGRVCTLDSVSVPDLFAIRRFATVHQMVSTIRGVLAPGVSPVDCIRAAFPGGSMTGAPKLRTMAILDELEGRPRGIYSGAIGYLGLDGSADFSIVIRTAICHGGEVRIGAGGAIVDLSEPTDEVAEVRLKVEALLGALGGVLEPGLAAPDIVARRDAAL